MINAAVAAAAAAAAAVAAAVVAGEAVVAASPVGSGRPAAEAERLVIFTLSRIYFMQALLVRG